MSEKTISITPDEEVDRRNAERRVSDTLYSGQDRRVADRRNEDPQDPMQALNQLHDYSLDPDMPNVVASAQRVLAQLDKDISEGTVQPVENYTRPEQPQQQ